MRRLGRPRQEHQGRGRMPTICDGWRGPAGRTDARPHAGTLTRRRSARWGTSAQLHRARLLLHACTFVSSDFTAVHVKHKVMHSTTVCGSNGVTALIAQQSPEGDRLSSAAATARSPSSTATTARRRSHHQRGPTESCSVGLDGSRRRCSSTRATRRRASCGCWRGRTRMLYAASLSVATTADRRCRADARASSAPRGRRRRRLPARPSDFATAPDGTARWT